MTLLSGCCTPSSRNTVAGGGGMCLAWPDHITALSLQEGGERRKEGAGAEGRGGVREGRVSVGVGEARGTS